MDLAKLNVFLDPVAEIPAIIRQAGTERFLPDVGEVCPYLFLSHTYHSFWRCEAP